MKRLLSIGIILLFIGISISSSTGFNLDKKSTTPFEGNLAEITEIQTSFFSEAENFVYFRKGEFENNVSYISFEVDSDPFG